MGKFSEALIKAFEKLRKAGLKAYKKKIKSKAYKDKFIAAILKKDE